MSTTSNLLLLGAFAGTAAIGFAIFKAKLKAQEGSGNTAPSFKAKPMLTPNEIEFLNRLEAAAPELRFCPQVAMGAVLNPNVQRQDKAYMSLRGKFAQKIIDFVAQDRKDGSIVAIIELDDRSHDSDKDDKRDAMLSQAGYKIVRWQSKSKPDAATIRRELLPDARAAAPAAQRAP
jgi:hypothetical protein